jgi:2-oxoglutarate ferredoxin oxidoreductase subunit gamma
MSAQGIVDRGGKMVKTRRYEIRIAGFGGQGVVTIGRILGEAFTLYEGKNSVNTHSYGPESRGGACKSEVVVSDGEIHYPNVRVADLFIALSQVALDSYIGYVKEGGIVLIDPRSVKNVPDRDKYRVHEVPTMDIAHEIGGVKFQNSVALGALFPLIAHMIKESSLRKAISGNVPPKTVEINLRAFERGMRYAEEGKAK